MTSDALTTSAFRRVAADGSARTIARDVARETPVAIEFNGLGYAVLMASPGDLDDLAHGFALAERVIDRPEDILSVHRHDVAGGCLLRIQLAPRCAARVVDRVRHRVAESGCGLCGISNLEQALRPLPLVRARTFADDAAVLRALDALPNWQALNRQTGAVHAAAICGADGTIRLAREDVGRHNAFDKAIGAMRRAGMDWEGGFALLSSRCSYDLVEKAVLSGCPMLATISAPTSLAITRAAGAKLPLRVLVRPDALLIAQPNAGASTGGPS
ncbi:MAG: formate dehydrogenase accessory sulfurtransferase FdhD [Caulobacter sp.]|nr:formate dehydrogenase accessory sulfurtransferase FdhD [Caulobacter sp.]